MAEQNVAVLDVGKTRTKLSLWGRSGSELCRLTRQNIRGDHLDEVGIREWLGPALRALRANGKIDAIVPIAHGAAAALVGARGLLLPVLDYEFDIPTTYHESYDLERDPFCVNGSPRLPQGLNLGSQLHYAEAQCGKGLQSDAQLLLWPQYWAWVLCGQAASETSSFGCHTDLWDIRNARPSPLAVRRGWDRHFPPLRQAGEVLGTISSEWAPYVGSTDVRVHCGLHDSNAGLIACQGYPEYRGKEVTVLSTGTWFVAMRQAPDATASAADLPADRDCLFNVDVRGRPVASARFMGGREIEMLSEEFADGMLLDAAAVQAALIDSAREVVAEGAMFLPAFVSGCGPFPDRQGGWVHRPIAPVACLATIGLYAALVADVCLNLIGASKNIVIEGRFARASLFVRALATLRPNDAIYICEEKVDVASGALRLIEPGLPPTGRLRRATPLDIDLGAYCHLWLSALSQRAA